MIPLEILAIIFGLASAISWGAGDFSGGCATKRTNVYSVVLVTQIIGIVAFPLLAVTFDELFPPFIYLIWGAFAGFFGAAGLIALYKGLAKSKMGIVAPMAAVVSVIIPVIYSAITDGLPSTYQILGFILAFIGIWLIVSMNVDSKVNVKSLEYPILAGLLFGLFFISIDNFSETAIYWPLTFSRITAFILISVFLISAKAVTKPTSDVIPIIIIAAIFNTGGVTFFALASEAGRLDVATILSSLSPAITVLLACILLKEHLVSRQWIGVIAALVAIILMSL
ncbi:DMT family transporter [Methanosalsum natronophilum]|uniref:DMT family transporter n=1 Tax=Methanosalsum natronophilum TaxID=768733 RepID=A0A3R7X5A3_9EURY|nr:MAG: DMT family transporter [Methanosalsum natronophilum]